MKTRIKCVFLAVLCLVTTGALQAQAQVSYYGPYTVTSEWQTLFTRSGVSLFAKITPGEDQESGAKIDWRVKNSTSKAAFLTGSFSVTGTPIQGTLLNGYPAGSTKDAGALPLSRVGPHQQAEFEGYAERIYQVNTIKITLEAIHFGDNVRSGSAY